MLIGPEPDPIGFSAINGIGPGATGYGTTVFSKDREFAISVEFSQGGETARGKQIDPFAWASKVALGTRTALFGE